MQLHGWWRSWLQCAFIVYTLIDSFRRCICRPSDILWRGRDNWVLINQFRKWVMLMQHHVHGTWESGCLLHAAFPSFTHISIFHLIPRDAQSAQVFSLEMLTAQEYNIYCHIACVIVLYGHASFQFGVVGHWFLLFHLLWNVSFYIHHEHPRLIPPLYTAFPGYFHPHSSLPLIMACPPTQPAPLLKTILHGSIDVVSLWDKMIFSGSKRFKVMGEGVRWPTWEVGPF